MEMAAPQTPEVIEPVKKNVGRKFVFALSFLAIIPVFIVFVVLFALYSKYDQQGLIARQSQRLHYQALPQIQDESFIELSSTDNREKALEDLFERYNSPLKGQGFLIIEQADLHGIDYRLLPSIAMQESTLCKKIIKNSHNCWGFGIYGGKVTRFESYEEAIKTITKTLATKYVQKGYVEPHEIVKKYTPSDDGKWVNTVNLMMDRIHEGL